MLWLLGARVVGLTGGIASGKSTVTEMLRAKNIPVIDADVIAREIVLPGKPAYNDIVRHFGTGILLEEGGLDRPKLGQIIFKNPSERKFLDGATHKRIFAQILKEIALNTAHGRRVMVLDAPLMLESRSLFKWLVRKIVVVYVDEGTQLERLLNRGLSSTPDSGQQETDREEAVRRINSQLPLSKKKAMADLVIDNNGSKAETQRQTPRNWFAVTTGNLIAKAPSVPMQTFR